MARQLVPLMEIPQRPGYGWCTEPWLRRGVEMHRFPYFKAAGKVLIDLAELDKYVENGRVEVPAGAV